MQGSNTLTTSLDAVNEYLRTLQGELAISSTSGPTINDALLAEHSKFLAQKKASLLDEWKLRYLWVNLNLYRNGVSGQLDNSDPLLEDLGYLIEHLAQIIPGRIFEFHQDLEEKSAAGIDPITAKQQLLEQYQNDLHHALLEASAITLVEKQLTHYTGTISPITEDSLNDNFYRLLLHHGAIDQFEILSVINYHRHLANQSRYDQAENAISNSHGNEKLKLLLYSRTHDANIGARYEGTKRLKAFIDDTCGNLYEISPDDISKRFFDSEIVTPTGDNVSQRLTSYYYRNQEAFRYEFQLYDGTTQEGLAHAKSNIALETKRRYNNGSQDSIIFPVYKIIDTMLLDDLHDTQKHYLPITDFFNSHHFENLSSFLRGKQKECQRFLTQSNVNKIDLWRPQNNLTPAHNDAQKLIKRYDAMLTTEERELGIFHSGRTRMLRRNTLIQLSSYISRLSQNIAYLQLDINKLRNRYSKTLGINQHLHYILFSDIDSIESSLSKPSKCLEPSGSKLRIFYGVIKKVLTEDIFIEDIIKSADTQLQQNLRYLKLVQLIHKADFGSSSLSREQLKFIYNTLDLKQLADSLDGDITIEDINVTLTDSPDIIAALSDHHISITDIESFNEKVYHYRYQVSEEMDTITSHQQQLITQGNKDCLNYVNTICNNQPHFYEFQFIALLRKIFTALGNMLSSCRRSPTTETPSDTQSINHHQFFQSSKRLFEQTPTHEPEITVSCSA